MILLERRLLSKQLKQIYWNFTIRSQQYLSKLMCENLIQLNNKNLIQTNDL